ncbi:hypothetical protein GJAV_G00000110 [Gymnothorax javanicus]|nr:hypothetical protein GJAV_G00000110 [Gymnothorax javanicus]
MGFALMGKLSMQMTTCVSQLYGIELFPTIIRQKCVGMVFLWYRVGCILNALTAFRGEIPLVAMLLYGSLPIVGAGLCLLLPETKGRPLPNTVTDCEAQLGSQRPLCCPPVIDPGRSSSFPRENQGADLSVPSSGGPGAVPEMP